MTDASEIIRRILRDIEVELGDEFDRNFERQGFFSEAWERRKSPFRPGGATLVDTGGLRKSIMTSKDANSITFRSDHPAAAIHNEGGEITVTPKMKRFFWAKYYEAEGAFGRRKRTNGSPRQDRKNIRLSTEAEFWRCMALMKVGSKIRIPQRRFLGNAPEVETAVREIIEENLDKFFSRIDFDVTEK